VTPISLYVFHLVANNRAMYWRNPWFVAYRIVSVDTCKRRCDFSFGSTCTEWKCTRTHAHAQGTKKARWQAVIHFVHLTNLENERWKWYRWKWNVLDKGEKNKKNHLAFLLYYILRKSRICKKISYIFHLKIIFRLMYSSLLFAVDSAAEYVSFGRIPREFLFIHILLENSNFIWFSIRGKVFWLSTCTKHLYTFSYFKLELMKVLEFYSFQISHTRAFICGSVSIISLIYRCKTFLFVIISTNNEIRTKKDAFWHWYFISYFE